jgi:molybdenum cofactor cytidylyltransferase
MAEGYADFVSVIVLALGRSTRSGQNQMLETIGERTMIGHVVYECLTSKAKQVIVVLGPDAEKVRSALKDYKCEIVFDEDFEKGQSYSIRKGLARVKEDTDAVMVIPGDISHVDRTRVNTLIRKYSTCYAPIVSKGYYGGPLRPILFDKNLLGDLRNISEETGGLQSILTKYGPKRQFVKISEASLLRLGKRRERLKARLGLSKRS